MTRPPRTADVAGLVTGLGSLYPAAMRAGIGYWSELAANTSSYCAGMLELMAEAWQHPGDAERVVADLVDRVRRHIEWSGDSLERAVLEFNQGLLAAGRPAGESPVSADGARIGETLRALADAASHGAWAVGEPHERPDLPALRQRLENLLTELRALDESPPRAARGGPGPLA